MPGSYDGYERLNNELIIAAEQTNSRATIDWFGIVLGARKQWTIHLSAPAKQASLSVGYQVEQIVAKAR